MKKKKGESEGRDANGLNLIKRETFEQRYVGLEPREYLETVHFRRRDPVPRPWVGGSLVCARSGKGAGWLE